MNSTPGAFLKMNREIIGHFDETWQDYDQWYDEHQALYQSELAALKMAVPSGLGLEIGVGTGRFAAPLGVRFGLDPAIQMLRAAKKRGISAVQGVGESLSFKEDSFDFVLIVFVIEFVDHLFLFLNEAARPLKKNGALILGFIDKDSRWGRYYAQDPSHRAHFHPPPAKEILDILKSTGMEFQETFQTLFQPPPDIRFQEKPRRGFGEGGFVVCKAVKTR
jgi:ubiquinone/menaquinone biosynthesis C-methylase UbiE